MKQCKVATKAASPKPHNSLAPAHIFFLCVCVCFLRTLWTPKAFHRLKLSRPTPQKDSRDPQPRARSAREAPLSGTAELPRIPCRETVSQLVSDTLTKVWILEIQRSMTRDAAVAVCAVPCWTSGGSSFWPRPEWSQSQQTHLLTPPP